MSIPFIETSAKTSTNVDEAFATMAKIIKDEYVFPSLLPLLPPRLNILPYAHTCTHSVDSQPDETSDSKKASSVTPGRSLGQEEESGGCSC